MAAHDIPLAVSPDAYLVGGAFLALVVLVMTVLAWSLGCFDGITWPARTAAAVIDFLRPSAGVIPAPTAKATRPRRPGAHRAANRSTRKRATTA